jgi:hypothetical protein
MKRSDALRLFAALVLAAACAACGDLPLGDPNDRLMTDAELMGIFQNERASFDSLAVMIGEERDSLSVQLNRSGDICILDDYGGRPPRDDAATTARWTAYERLLRRVRVGRNVWADTTRILFQQYVNKFGPEDSRWMRGYYYARQPLPTYNKLREGDLLTDPGYAKPPYESTTLYRHLDGPWYLFSNKGYTD